MKKPLLMCLIILGTFFFLNACKKSSGSAPTHWNELGSGKNALNANSFIDAMVVDAAGNIYVAGQFTNTDGAHYVAKWDGTSWTELGGINSLRANAEIGALAIDPSGNIYATGYFKNSKGYPYVAKFDGNNWTEIGSSFVTPYMYNSFPLCTDAAGNVYAQKYLPPGQTMAKWNGTTWSAVDSDLGGETSAVIVDINHNVFMCSANLNFYLASTHTSTCPFLIWNGNQLIVTCSGTTIHDFVMKFATDAVGNVFAAGAFACTNNKTGVAKWNDSSWIAVDSPGFSFDFNNNTINSITLDISSNLYAAGNFRDSLSGCFVAKWNGTSWSKLPFDNIPTYFRNPIRVVCTDASGNLYAAGEFMNTNKKQFVAKYTK